MFTMSFPCDGFSLWRFFCSFTAARWVRHLSRSPRLARYIYWTNYKTGAVGWATITGTSPNESFIKTGVAGGAGLTATSQFLYWTSANLSRRAVPGAYAGRAQWRPDAGKEHN